MRPGLAIISRCAILPQVKPRAICGMIRAYRKDALHMDRTQTARIKRELAKIKKGLRASDWDAKEHYALYAAQQALAWVLDPKEVMAPAKMISELCPDL
jgi:hypothetical protein